MLGNSATGANSRPFVGRTRELEAVSRRLLAPVAERGGVVLISGEAGIGKSRLLGETATLAEANGWRVFVGHAFDTEGMPPYQPFIEAMQAYVRECPAVTLRAHMGADAAEIALLLPDIRRRLPELSSGSDQDANGRRFRLFEGAATLLDAIALEAASGLLLCLEDLHWADDSTLLLLDHLARRPSAGPVLIVATYRDTEPGSSKQLAATIEGVIRLASSQRLELKRLSREDVGVMLASLGPPNPGRALVNTVFKETEGNPFFVREVFEYLAGEGRLFDAGGGWLEDVQIGESDVPQSVRLVIERRLQRMSSGCRQLLALAAVIGRTFSYDLVCLLSEMEEDVLFEALEEAERSHLLTTDTSGGHAFAHELIRQTLLSAQALPRRQRLHQRIAVGLEELYGAEIAVHLPKVAANYHLAGMFADAGKAYAYALQAGDGAVAVYAFQEATSLYGMALEAAARSGDFTADVHHKRGNAYELLGKFDEAFAEYEAELAEASRADDKGARWQALLDLGMLWASRDYALAGDYFEQASDLAREIGDPAQIAHSLNRVANWLVNSERPQEGVERHEEALAIFESLGDKAAIAGTLDLLGMATCLAGDMVRSSETYRQAIPLLEELDDRPALASSLSTLLGSGDDYITDAVVVADAPVDFYAIAERALTVAREAGLRPAEAYAQWQRAVFFGARGEYGVALDAGRDGLAISLEVGHVQWEAGCRCALGALLLDLMDLEGARRELNGARRLAYETKSGWWDGVSGQLMAQVLIAQGALDEAEALLASLGRAEPPWTVLQRQAEAAWIDLALARGQATEAVRLIGRLLENDANIDGKSVIPRVWRQHARALVALGKPFEADTLLTAALATCLERGQRNLAWRLQADLARLPGPKAAENADGASQLIDELASSIGEEPLAATFRETALGQLEGGRPGEVPPPSRKVYVDGLSEREVEVLRLIVAGRSSREIGEALVLSIRTVERHIANIYVKTGTHGRAQVTAYALQRGLG